jgi:hypothetical protein
MYFIYIPNRAAYEISWKSILEPGRSHMTTWRTRISCRMTKATDSQPCYVICTDFARQKWLQEHRSLLSNTYIVAIV